MKNTTVLLCLILLWAPSTAAAPDAPTLEERDLLSVQDTLDTYIPDYPDGDKIKLHHLLTHTSGVINYSALPNHYRVWTATLHRPPAALRESMG